MNNPIPQATFKQATRIMELINQSDNYNCYFEGIGNGKVKLILEEKVVRIV